MTEGPIKSRLSRYYRLTLRVQKYSVSRFNECAS